MAYERQRAADDPQLSISVPDAPLPLAKSVLERFRYGARKAAAQLSSPEGASKDAATLTANLGPAFSQTTTHECGLKIRALDINQSRTHVVLAGGKLLKTVRVSQEPSCTEDFNLRTKAVNYAWDSLGSNSSAGKPRTTVPDSNSVQRDMFDIEDVAWSNNEFRDYIATAARNGKIMLYDMNRPGVEVGSLHEHYRQVHKVDFNPLEGACLLSGSQDGTVRLWDIRSYQMSASMDTYAGRAEGVRHVKWSPRDTWSFAFGTDNGVIQRWDTRNNRAPILKFSAHHETCNSIDWHPDGKHLISGGKDQIIKVWDISPGARRRASFHVRTPMEVQNVRWRPSCFVLEPQEHQTIKQCTHFASSYRNYPVIQIWDLRRPHMPFREVNHGLNTGTTDMLWRSRDLLWSVGPEGEFTQTDVSYAPKTLERRPLASVSCGPGGQVTFVCKKRVHHGLSTSEGAQIRKSEIGSFKRPSHSQDGMPYGRSPGDDSFDEKFLEPPARKGHVRAPSFKSVKSLGTTPPSTDEMARMAATDLKATMSTYENFNPKQASRSGSLPGTFQSELFTYMLQNYKQLTSPQKYSVDYLKNIRAVFEQNAACAQKASLYRDAQMWRILGYQISKDLQHRAQANRLVRLKNRKKEDQLAREEPSSEMSKTVFAGSKIRDIHSPDLPSKSKLMSKNQSNTPTPVVRAMEKESSNSSVGNDHVNEIQLPPSLGSGQGLGSTETTSDSSFEREKALLGATEARNNDLAIRRARHNQSPQMPRAPYSLDILPQQTQTISVPTRALRRDSSEDFWMFSTSSESPARRGNQHSLPSTEVRSMTRSVSDEYDGLRFDSSFQSSGSGQSRLSLLERRESFLDLPTHGNLRVDDFVEAETTSMPPADSSLNIDTGPGRHAPMYESPEENTSPVRKPQYPPTKMAPPSTARSGVPSEKSKSSRDVSLELSPSRSKKSSSRADGTTNAIASLSVAHERYSDSEDIMLVDYLVPNECEKSANTISSVINSGEMIVELLKWYSSQGDALTAAHIFFLSLPLLTRPDLRTRNDSKAEALQPSYNDVAPSSGPTAVNTGPEALQEQLANLSEVGLSSLFVESLLTTYHEELVALDLINFAASFRRLSYPTFPGVYEQGLKDIEVNMLCLGCSHPINNPQNKMYCESCQKRQENCSICYCAHSPFDWAPDGLPRNKCLRNPATAGAARKSAGFAAFPGRSSSLWATCMLCNHSTHMACADQWFADVDSESKGSGGACPVPNCTCDCVRGWYRLERLKTLEAKERQRRQAAPSIGMGGGVKRDNWSVTESNAVGRVRGALRESRAFGPGSGEQGNSDSKERHSESLGFLGGQGRTMSDEGKRVRLIAPDESRR